MDYQASRQDDNPARRGSAQLSQGLPFLVLGAMVYEMARQRGLGKDIPRELLLQNSRD